MGEFLTYSYEKLLSSNTLTVDGLILLGQQSDAERTPLEQLAEINPNRLRSANIQGDVFYPYIEIKSISVETGEVSPTFVKGSELPARAKLKAKPGDVLLSLIRPERSIVAMIPDNYPEFIVSSSLVVLSPKGDVDTKALFSMLKAEEVTNELKMMTSGTTIPSLSLKQIKEYEIPVSNFTVNDRAYIAESTADYQINTKNEQLSFHDIVEAAYRPLLLSEKELNERHSVIPYSELISNDRFDAGFYIDRLNYQIKWTEHEEKLGVVVNEVRVGRSIPSNLKKTVPTSDSVRYLTAKNLSENSIDIQEEEMVFLDIDNIPTKSGTVERNSIVLVRQGINNLGVSALITNSLENALANHLLMILHVNDNLIIPEYLAYFLKTGWARRQINALSSDLSTGRFISQNSIKELIFPLPNMEGQQRIVEKINLQLKKM
ncbi:restriction endonuclease subunit S [Bacillus sp. V5-8f]|uniref:restriction endonuclease subunit S n=1 Tax=Bacillus sp. V5-8f TaxID=2053044 RepID=UPI000C787876|nr:restriction endonuclease subunit S [Bacillus sp. V5-8f]PLT33637.1 hypothetical protein CUU64_10935 [Bacillus sp. V5-8f]